MINVAIPFTKDCLYGATHHRWRGPPPYFTKGETGMIGFATLLLIQSWWLEIGDR